MRFIYNVRGAYGAPASTKGYFGSPESVALAVSKQAGTKLESAFNKEGIAKLVKGLRVDQQLSIANCSITKHTLK